jgi:hypothetical protein
MPRAVTSDEKRIPVLEFLNISAAFVRWNWES